MIVLFIVNAQNIKDELAAVFHDIPFWTTYQCVELTGDFLELIIPDQCVKQQGYLISPDRTCTKVQLSLAFGTYKYTRA